MKNSSSWEKVFPSGLTKGEEKQDLFKKRDGELPSRTILFWVNQIKKGSS
jgi:hypothetical protein